VINNHPRVAPETAEAVRKVMLKIGYSPSANRPGPKPANRTRTQVEHHRFAVLALSPKPGANPPPAAPGFEQLMHGVSTAAARHGVELTYFNVPDSPELFEQRLLQHRVTGLFTHGIYPAPLRARVQRFPSITLMGNRRRPDFGDQVMQDPYSVGELAAKYLLDRGHRSLAFLNLDSFHWAIHLYGHAFEATARAAGAEVVSLEQEKKTTEVAGEFDGESVDRMVNAYLALPNRPTGLFVAEDAQAAVLQPALQRAGVQIGAGKTEIVSCNNERPYLLGLSPAPATIDIRISTIGERGLEQLLRRVESPPASLEDRVVMLIQPRLVVPESNGQ
jgi:DNA-binding LacI/PurR family transcriptional regulator